MWSNDVDFTTTCGPDGTAFKPSRSRGKPCGTGVSGLPAPVDGRRWDVKRCLGGRAGRSSRPEGTAFKPCAATPVRGRHRRDREGLRRGVVDQPLGGAARRGSDDDHQPPQPPRHRTPQDRPEADGPSGCRGGEALPLRGIAQGGCGALRGRLADARPQVPKSGGRHPTTARLASFWAELSARPQSRPDLEARRPHEGRGVGSDLAAQTGWLTRYATLGPFGDLA